MIQSPIKSVVWSESLHQQTLIATYLRVEIFNVTAIRIRRFADESRYASPPAADCRCLRQPPAMPPANSNQAKGRFTLTRIIRRPTIRASSSYECLFTLTRANDGNTREREITHVILTPLDVTYGRLPTTKSSARPILFTACEAQEQAFGTTFQGGSRPKYLGG